MSEENINNKYLDIVDNSILGNGAAASDAINSILKDKIATEIDDYKKEFANSMFNGEQETDVDSEEEVEAETPEEETEETEEA